MFIFHFEPFALHEISLIELAMGDITQALETVSQGLRLSYQIRDLSDLRTEFAFKAYCEFPLGNMHRAYQDFEIAFCYAQRRQANQQFLYSGSGIYQAEFFIRLGVWKWFEAVNAWNMEICEEEHWNQHLALCHLLQSWYEICRKRFPQAKAALTQAERILRSSGLVEYVCRLDWA